MRYFFDFLFLIGLILILPFVVLKMITAGKYRRGIGQRFGFIPTPPGDGPLIWLHAVSVGELQAARGLVAHLQEAYPSHRIAISHTTRTGEDVAAQLYPALTRFYFALDFSFITRRVMRKLNPELIILMELELWPNFLLAARAQKRKVFIANGRISQSSSDGYRKAAFALAKPFQAITLAAVQDEEYASRLRALFGRMQVDEERVHVAGNLKFDNISIGVNEVARLRYRELFGFNDDEIVLVCGSTHPGEHEELVELYKRIRNQGTNLRMVVVPRHPERWTGVRTLWRQAGVALVDRSSLGSGRMMAVNDGSGIAPCVLLDTMGELSDLYNAGDVVFIGGSMIPHGGQNMAEPAGLGRAVCFGPHTKNFKSTVRDLLEAKAAIQVHTWDELQATIIRLAGDPAEREQLGQRAQVVVQAGKGSVEEHMKLIKGLLSAE